MNLLKKSRSNNFNGLLDYGTTLTGELKFSGRLRVDGTVHGSISTKDLLIVGSKASINADIKAGEIQIYGTVFGNIEGNRKIEIFSTGRLRGDVRTPQLVIEEGGRFEGYSWGLTELNSDEAVSDFGASETSQTDHS